MSHQSPDISNLSNRKLNVQSRTLLSACVLLALVVGAGSANAALVLFTDRAAWRIAAGGGTGDIVDNLNTGTTTRTGYTLGGGALSYPVNNALTGVDGSVYAEFNLEDGFTGIFTFSSAITALGYDVNPYPDDAGTTVLVAASGGQNSSYVLSPSDVTTFVGFVSDSTFTSFTISENTGFAYHGVDNLEAFLVPEPSTYFAAGFLALAAGHHLVRTRRSQLKNSN